MITAHEARELAADSRVQVEKVLNTLDPLIRAAAQRGDKSIIYAEGRLSWRNDENVTKERENGKFAKSVAYSLGTLGFTAGMCADSRRYTVGMDDKEYFNYVFKVEW